MGKVEKISVALTEELADAVRGAVESGRYASASEVVRDALRDWTDREERRESALRLGQLWDEGIVSGVAEEREPREAFLARNRARLAAMKGA